MVLMCLWTSYTKMEAIEMSLAVLMHCNALHLFTSSMNAPCMF
jgi:hypothetical protein